MQETINEIRQQLEKDEAEALELITALAASDNAIDTRAGEMEETAIEITLLEADLLGAVTNEENEEGKKAFPNAETRKAEVKRRLEESELTEQLRELGRDQRIDEMGRDHNWRMLRLIESRMANRRAILGAITAQDYRGRAELAAKILRN